MDLRKQSRQSTGLMWTKPEDATDLSLSTKQITESMQKTADHGFHGANFTVPSALKTQD